MRSIVNLRFLMVEKSNPFLPQVEKQMSKYRNYPISQEDYLDSISVCFCS